GPRTVVHRNGPGSCRDTAHSRTDSPSRVPDTANRTPDTVPRLPGTVRVPGSTVARTGCGAVKGARDAPSARDCSRDVPGGCRDAPAGCRDVPSFARPRSPAAEAVTVRRGPTPYSADMTEEHTVGATWLHDQDQRARVFRLNHDGVSGIAQVNPRTVGMLGLWFPLVDDLRGNLGRSLVRTVGASPVTVLLFGLYSFEFLVDVTCGAGTGEHEEVQRDDQCDHQEQTGDNEPPLGLHRGQPLVHRGRKDTNLVAGQDLTTADLPFSAVTVRLEGESAVVIGGIVLIMERTAGVQSGSALCGVSCRPRLATSVTATVELDRPARPYLGIGN